MNALIIIPARWKSSRFPGKPLAKIGDKTLIERVWERCAKTGITTFVATDDNRIAGYCIERGILCIETDDCLTGTDRIAQAYKMIERDFPNTKTIINVQGDEPLVSPEDILAVANAHSKISSDHPFMCGMTAITNEEDFYDPNIVKITVDQFHDMLYASRAGIPTDKSLKFHFGYRQVCIYAFTPDALSAFADESKSELESIEDIELLRILENGWNIKMIKVSGQSIAVNVPEDIQKVLEALNE